MPSIDVTLEERDDLPMGLVGVEFNIEYHFTKGQRGCMYGPGGDPGWPDEPDVLEYGDREVMTVWPEGEPARGPRPDEEAAIEKWINDHIEELREKLDELAYEDLDAQVEGDEPDYDEIRERNMP